MATPLYGRRGLHIQPRSWNHWATFSPLSGAYPPRSHCITSLSVLQPFCSSPQLLFSSLFLSTIMPRGGRSSRGRVAGSRSTAPRGTRRSRPYQPRTRVARGSRLPTSQQQHDSLPTGTDTASADDHGTPAPNLFPLGSQVADLSVEDFIAAVRAVVRQENAAASQATSLPLSTVLTLPVTSGTTQPSGLNLPILPNPSSAPAGVVPAAPTSVTVTTSTPIMSPSQLAALPPHPGSSAGPSASSGMGVILLLLVVCTFVRSVCCG